MILINWTDGQLMMDRSKAAARQALDVAGPTGAWQVHVRFTVSGDRRWYGKLVLVPFEERRDKEALAGFDAATAESIAQRAINRFRASPELRDSAMWLYRHDLPEGMSEGSVAEIAWGGANQSTGEHSDGQDVFYLLAPGEAIYPYRPPDFRRDVTGFYRKLTTP